MREGNKEVIVPQAGVNFGLNDRTVEAVAKEACEDRELFHIWFIHADTGGRNLEATASERGRSYSEKARDLCNLPTNRNIFINPRKETEAWLLCDRKALYKAFGLAQNYKDAQLPEPNLCETVQDPKQILNSFARRVNEKRYSAGAAALYASIAINQDLSLLRQLTAFQSFEVQVRSALRTLGCI